MAYKIFYSWQSDLPSTFNRSFIEKALKKATTNINKEFTELEAVIDRDTKDEAGSPDIVQTIFNKIEKSDIFVCDVSVINKAEDYNYRLTPNPNVLVELGYALKTLGPSHIIMIINETHGCIEDLPFDLDHRRVLRYVLNESDKCDPEKLRKCQEELVQDLSKAISTIVNQFLPQSLSEDLWLIEEKVRHTKLRFTRAIKCVIEIIEPNLILPSFVDLYKSIEDEFDEIFSIFDGTKYLWCVYDKTKLIEYSNKVESLIETFMKESEIKNRLFTPIIYNKLIDGKEVKIANVVTPIIDQEYPDILDIYFKILSIVDSRTHLWKERFENVFVGRFEGLTIEDEINEKKAYIEDLEVYRSEIIRLSSSLRENGTNKLISTKN